MFCIVCQQDFLMILQTSTIMWGNAKEKGVMGVSVLPVLKANQMLYTVIWKYDQPSHNFF